MANSSSTKTVLIIGASRGHMRDQALEALELVLDHRVAGFQHRERVEAGRASGKGVAAALGHHVAILRPRPGVDLTGIN